MAKPQSNHLLLVWGFLIFNITDQNPSLKVFNSQVTSVLPLCSNLWLAILDILLILIVYCAKIPLTVLVITALNILYNYIGKWLHYFQYWSHLTASGYWIISLYYHTPTKLGKDNVLTGICLFIGGPPCEHYPWCIVPHCPAPPVPLPWTSDLSPNRH